MSRVSPKTQLRRCAVLAVLALCGCALGLGAASGGLASIKADPVLNVFYVGTTGISARLDDGTTVRSGSVIPPGAYSLLVYDDDYMTPRFTLSGPGVNVSSDLNSTGMGIDAPSTLGPITLQPSSSYRIQDTNMGAAALITFTTSASAGSGGGSSGGGSTGGGSSGGGSSGGSGSTGGTKSSGTTVKTLGTISGTVTATGKKRVLVTLNGKTPKTLKAGVYKVVVVDNSKTAGIVFVDSKLRVISLSGKASVGKTTRNVTLAAGKWYFMNPAGGAKTFFTVTK